MIKEFKQFAFKGNVIDMAVGIIIGGAFGTVVKSLVDNVLMPPLGKLIAGVDFTKMNYVLEPRVAEVKNAAGEIITVAQPEVAIAYGQFITDCISFLLLAFAMFLVIKKFLGAFKKEEEKPTEPPKPSNEEVLLSEIRDELKKQNS